LADFDFQSAFDRIHERMNEIHEQGIETSTKLKGLVGNGQPGKIQAIEAELKDISLWRAKIVGYLAAVSGVIALAGFASHFLFDYLKK
jgi:hypothetical protein